MNKFVLFVISVGIGAITIAEANSSCPQKADVGFIVDSSGSLSSHYGKEKDFVKQMINRLQLSASGIHSSLILFSHSASLRILFSDYDNGNDFNKAVDALPLLNSVTRIDKALKVASDRMFKQANGMRSYVPHTLILLTDGQQTSGPDVVPPSVAVKPLHKAGIKVIVVGIGSGVNPTELKSIVNSPKYLYFFAKDFDELRSPAFVDKVTHATCNPIPGPTGPTDCTTAKPPKPKCPLLLFWIASALGLKRTLSSKGGLIAWLPWFSSGCPGLIFVQRCPGLNQRSPGSTRCPGLKQKYLQSRGSGCQWELQASNVCYGSRGDKPGAFKLKQEGFLTGIKLEHVSGNVSCLIPKSKYWSHWGCNGADYYNPKSLNTIITDDTNLRVYPNPQTWLNTGSLWYRLPGYQGRSSTLVFSGFCSPMYARYHQDMKVWYGEDLTNNDGDNDYASHCVNVYAMFKKC